LAADEFSGQPYAVFCTIEMRKKLKRYGIEIKTCWEMPEASKAIARTAATGPVAV
jgi:hypothetical protein